MPEVSRRGIYYRLDKSPYIVKYGPLTFYFSSQLYRQKFFDGVQAEIDIYNYRKTVKTRIKSTAIYTPAFEFYRHIETRGFYVVLEWLGKHYEITKPDDLRIADIPEVIING